LPDANKNSEKKTIKQNQVKCRAVTRKMKNKFWENKDRERQILENNIFLVDIQLEPHKSS
jgi:hypothetical protein